MDESVRLENIRNMTTCDEAELLLRELRGNTALAQKQNEPNFLHLAHAALEDIW